MTTDGGTLLSRTDFHCHALDNLIRRVMFDGSLAVTSVVRYVADAWNPAKAGGVGIKGTDSLLDLDGSNAAVVRRVFGDRVDEIVTRVAAGGAERWYVTDRQGTVRAALDDRAGRWPGRSPGTRTPPARPRWGTR